MTKEMIKGQLLGLNKFNFVPKQLNEFCARYSKSTSSTFKFSDLTIEKTKKPNTKPDNDKLIFGHHFADHMFTVKWTANNGWEKPKITPLQNFSLHPATKCLHYANEIFEGMKAYRGVDDKVRLFRPDQNMIRMLRSAERATLPTFDGNEFLSCIRKLISIDKDWVPHSTKCSLYVRPTLIGTDPTLGVLPPQEALLYVINGPVGPYFATGLKPVSLMADPAYIRAPPGGCGFAKMGSNYAPTTYVQLKAMERGCQQVLWLIGEEHRVTEVGTMNVFVFWKNEKGNAELITPSLDGTILPGVTRDSVLKLAAQWNQFEVSEGVITMKQIIKALEEGRLFEMFGAGTACVVCPIERILYEGKSLSIPTMTKGAPVTMRLLKDITDIQYGRKGDHEWVVDIDMESSDARVANDAKVRRHKEK